MVFGRVSVTWATTTTIVRLFNRRRHAQSETRSSSDTLCHIVVMLKYDRRALRRHTYARAPERTHAQTVERGSWSRHRFTYARNNGGARHRRTFRSPLVAEPAPLRSSFSLALRRRVTRARDITELQP